jgi:hypothetical protein
MSPVVWNCEGRALLLSQEKDQLREVCAREHKECELLQIKVQQMELYHTRYAQEQTDRHRMEVEELHSKIGKLQEVWV